MICVISWHEKGFWNADMYEDDDENYDDPIGYATGKRGTNRYELINRVIKQYSGIKLIAGVIETCLECGEEIEDDDKRCSNCDEPF